MTSSYLPSQNTTFAQETGEQRLALLHNACRQDFPETEQLAPSDGDKILVSEKHSLGYCNVPKVGSSFWFATFAILEDSVWNTSSPNELVSRLVEDVPKKTAVKSYRKLSSTARQDLNQHGHMFLFVRDPYQRLLSTYVNKFLSPNAFYWGSFGKQIIADYRPGASQHSKKCGHDVTLSEFLRYVTESNDSDPHWTSVYHLCSPCHYAYKFIGKAESFEEDAVQLLIRFNMTRKVLYKPQYDKDVSFYMRLKIEQFIDHYRRVKHCLTLPELVDRLWETFKAKGYLKLTDKPPLRALYHYDIDSQEFKDVLFEVAVARYKLLSLDGRMSSVGEQFVRQRFGQIELDILHRIKVKFWADFALFGYNPEPRHLFQRPNISVFLFVNFLFLVCVFSLCAVCFKLDICSFHKIKLRF
ncbi:carbohydrate sulfotransferase 11-like [Liolophura sinensis]|uniref:carbohydrate sulfotransferase 11-like n=1 Tax=Liolophura sinensis TaxID=3198878 RepID=UPI0031581FF7